MRLLVAVFALLLAMNQRNKSKHRNDQPSTHPQQGGGNEKSTNRHVYIEPGAKIDFVQDLKEKYDSAQGDNKTHNDRQLFWTKIASGLLLITAGFSGWQGCTAHRLIKNTSTQFQKDQRPYVWYGGSFDPNGLHVVENEKLSLNIHWINYGRSPATRVVATSGIFFGPDAMEKADDWFVHLGTDPLPENPPSSEMVVPPGIPSDPIKTFGGFSTIQTDKPLASDMVNYILSTDEPLAMVIRVQYYDGYGNRYWSDMCLSRFKNGAIPHCRKHNDIH